VSRTAKVGISDGVLLPTPVSRTARVGIRDAKALSRDQALNSYQDSSQARFRNYQSTASRTNTRDLGWRNIQSSPDEIGHEHSRHGDNGEVMPVGRVAEVVMQRPQPQVPLQPPQRPLKILPHLRPRDYMEERGRGASEAE
jgi:hypothetical protein